ncbi:hypothetical protein GbCGDNIH3_7186 [Granulibacter bethesdensis]|uniref:Uncharacterized protein n=1 Tax=Granulibacter bethesdensis TaxID=364410 RepID=A0AAN0RC23_9PROT|nr:hypothetical protein GbCGDNIH3_7186 [Granulibacter bethesdensis]
MGRWSVFSERLKRRMGTEKAENIDINRTDLWQNCFCQRSKD